MRIRYLLTLCVVMLYNLCGIAQGGSAKTTLQGTAVTARASHANQEQPSQEVTAGQPANAQQATSMEQTTNTGESDITVEQETGAGDFHGIESQEEPDVSSEDSQVAPSGGEVTNTTDDNDDSINWFPLLLSLLAFGLSGYVFYVSQIRNSRKKKHNFGNGDSIFSPDLREILQQNQDIRLSFSLLKSRVEELEQKFESITAPKQFAPPQKQSRFQENNNRGVSSSVTRYAAMVTSEGFPEGDLTDSNSDYTLAILTLTGGTGTFVINNMDSAQSFLISNFAYSVGRICEVKQQSEAATRVETVRAGKISRDGNIWKIISKAEVILV